MGNSESRSVVNTWRQVDAVCLDVDRTAVTHDTIEELARWLNKGDALKRLYHKSDNGQITVEGFYEEMFRVFPTTEKGLEEYNDTHPPSLTPGVRELVDTLHERGVHVYIVSSGVEILVKPVARALNVPEENIFANKIIFIDGMGVGVEPDRLSAHSGGKTKVIQHLRKVHQYKCIAMIGDGVVDITTGIADLFIGFGGNFQCDMVKKYANWYVTDFNELTDALKDK